MMAVQNIASDKSYPSKDRAKCQGYLRQWNTSKIIVNVAFYADLLEPVKILSLSLQDEEIDTVKAIRALDKTKTKLLKMKDHDVRNFPSMKSLIRRVTTSSDGASLDSLPLQNFEKEVHLVQNKKNRELQLVQDVMFSRLEDNDSPYLNAVSEILYCEGWERSKTDNGKETADVEFADDHIITLNERFQEPLQNAAMNCSEVELLDEWHDLITHAVNSMTPSRVSYLKTWRRIFSSPRARDFRNILLLVELAFCMPVANAQAERLFSRLKRIKTDTRCSLGPQRLENIVRIGHQGPPLDKFDPVPATSAWYGQKRRRMNQRKRHPYRRREKANDESGSDSSSDDGSDIDDSKLLIWK